VVRNQPVEGRIQFPTRQFLHPVSERNFFCLFSLCYEFYRVLIWFICLHLIRMIVVYVSPDQGFRIAHRISFRCWLCKIIKILLNTEKLYLEWAI